MYAGEYNKLNADGVAVNDYGVCVLGYIWGTETNGTWRPIQSGARERSFHVNKISYD